MNGNTKAKFAGIFVAIWVSAAGIAYAQDHADTHADPHGNTAAPHVDSKDSKHDSLTPGGNETSGHEAAGHGETGHGEASAAGGHAGAGEHGAAAHEGGEHHGPAPINWTDIWDKKRPAFLSLVINFGLLASLYYYLGRKPIAAGLKQRRITIGKDIDEASKMLEEAKKRAEKYQADLKNVDADAATAKATLVTAGKGEAQRVIEEAQERAERMKRDAERLVDQERKQLVVDLQRDTVELAVKEAVAILEKGVTPDDHQRLANDLLAELARRPGARPAGGTGQLPPPRTPPGSGSVSPPRGAS